MDMPRWLRRLFRSSSQLVNSTNKKNEIAEQIRLRETIDMSNLSEDEKRRVNEARWL